MPKPQPAAPVTQTTEPAPTAGFDGLGNEEPAVDDKPFDDEPFDAGVEADEASDPKKYIEQLTGKLGQSLRNYEESTGQPDFELEKFAINSLLSATHTSEMDDNDRNDIIKKVNTAGNDGENSEGSDFDDSNNGSDNNDANNMGSNDEFGDFSQSNDNNDEEDLEETEAQIFETEDLFLKEPVRCDMFQPSSFDALKKRTGKDLKESYKKSIFAKLHESLNQDEPMRNSEIEPAEPIVKPDVKPDTTPVQPNRRNKPFLPMPDIAVPPKAMNENINKLPVYHGTFTSAVITAADYAKSKGYDINEDEWFNTISTGPRKPQEGETNRYSLPLYVNGKEQKKQLHIQVYGMKDKYELNTYIN